MNADELTHRHAYLAKNFDIIIYIYKQAKLGGIPSPQCQGGADMKWVLASSTKWL